MSAWTDKVLGIKKLEWISVNTASSSIRDLRMHDLVSKMSRSCRSTNAYAHMTGPIKTSHSTLEPRNTVLQPSMTNLTSFTSLAFLAFIIVSFLPNDSSAFPGSIDPITDLACLPGGINSCGKGCARCVCCGPDVSIF